MYSISTSFKRYYADKKQKLKHFFCILTIYYLSITLIRTIAQNFHQPTHIFPHMIGSVIIGIICMLCILSFHYIIHRCIHLFRYTQLKHQIEKHDLYSICDTYFHTHSFWDLMIFFTDDTINKTRETVFEQTLKTS